MRLEEQTQTVMWVASVDTPAKLLGIIAVADPLKPTAREAVRNLQEKGLETVLLTGDNERTAAAIAGQVGIERVLAGVLPGDKAAEVRRLQRDGKRVGMVGDGVNDAPALAAADVGIAMGTGADVAMETAGVTLMRGNPLLVGDAIAVSRATYSKIRQGLFWGIYLQHRRSAARSPRPFESVDRGGGDGVFLRQRGDERAAAATLASG
jgi:Cu+-exporting ATPase